MPGRPAFRSLADIVRNGYCLSCGLCTQLVEPGTITMALTRDQQLRPWAHRALSVDEEARIVRLCPGVSLRGPMSDRVEEEEEDDYDGGEREEPVWGHVVATYEGWAADEPTRHAASAGGVMTAVNRYLLESGRAAFILQVRAGGDDALSSAPCLVRDPDELLTGSASRYAPSAPLTAVTEALRLSLIHI